MRLVDIDNLVIEDLLIMDRDYINEFASGVRKVMNALRRLPTVDAMEVVHGRWKFLDIDGWWFDECSICGNTTPNRDGSPPGWNYCHNCGARMDKKDG